MSYKIPFCIIRTHFCHFRVNLRFSTRLVASVCPILEKEMRCFWSAPELTSIFQDRIVHCVLDLSMTRMRLRYTSPGCRAFRGKPRGITVKFYWKTIKDLELAWIKPSSQWLGSVNGIWTLYRDSAVLQFLHLLSERGIAGGVKVFHGFGADPWGLELDEVEKLEQLKFKSKRVLLLF